MTSMERAIRILSRATAIAVALLAGAVAQASAGSGAVAPEEARITAVNCYPAAHCGANAHIVWVHGTLEIQGTAIGEGMEVLFPERRLGLIGPGSARATLREEGSRLLVSVPPGAHSGDVEVVYPGGHTPAYGPIILSGKRLHPPPASSPGGPFASKGMWIWYVRDSSGGSAAAIIAKAHATGVRTVYIKSADAANYWPQFSSPLIAELHAAGLKVCAWQYVYGTRPAAEAAVGARAVKAGANCLVIDAEEQYEGEYAAAQTYIKDLRASIGASFPLALASFPWIFYHPSFPYSVFLGPDGAQYNLPQMYWKAIGVSVDSVYAYTYVDNRIYRRRIFPLGQTYEHVDRSELMRFRQDARLYGADGYSFWDWQETIARQWRNLAEPLLPAPANAHANGEYPLLTSRAEHSDAVLWMQEHLATAIAAQPTNGIFEKKTVANLIAFQHAHGIAPTGTCEAATWKALLALAPVNVVWTGRTHPST